MSLPTVNVRLYPVDFLLPLFLFPPLLSPLRALADEYWKEEGGRKKRTPNLESREKRRKRVTTRKTEMDL